MFHFLCLFRRKECEERAISRRMISAEISGLVLGLIAFFTMPMLVDGLSPFFRWGTLLWYLTFGAVVGLAGLAKPFKISPLLRGGITGAWLNFVVAMLMYEQSTEMMSMMQNVPFQNVNVLLLATIEGLILGAIIDMIATKVENR